MWIDCKPVFFGYGGNWGKNTNFTPNDIEVLIHYYVSPEEHPRISASAVRESIKNFQSQDIISMDGKVTEKGKKLVEMICSTPIPIQKWTDPRNEPT